MAITTCITFFTFYWSKLCHWQFSWTSALVVCVLIVFTNCGTFPTCVRTSVRHDYPKLITVICDTLAVHYSGFSDWEWTDFLRRQYSTMPRAVLSVNLGQVANGQGVRLQYETAMFFMALKQSMNCSWCRSWNDKPWPTKRKMLKIKSNFVQNLKVLALCPYCHIDHCLITPTFLYTQLMRISTKI